MTFVEFMRAKYGKPFVVARKTPRIMAVYPNHVYLSQKQYFKLYDEWRAAELPKMLRAELDKWSTPQSIRLHGGEMSADEVYAIEAVIKCIRHAMMGFI